MFDTLFGDLSVRMSSRLYLSGFREAKETRYSYTDSQDSRIINFACVFHSLHCQLLKSPIHWFYRECNVCNEYSRSSIEDLIGGRRGRGGGQGALAPPPPPPPPPPQAMAPPSLHPQSLKLSSITIIQRGYNMRS